MAQIREHTNRKRTLAPETTTEFTTASAAKLDFNTETPNQRKTRKPLLSGQLLQGDFAFIAGRATITDTRGRSIAAKFAELSRGKIEQLKRQWHE